MITEARVDVLTFLVKNDKKLSGLPEILKISNSKYNRITIHRTLITLCTMKLIYKMVIKNRPFYGASALQNVPGGKTIRPSAELCHFHCESCGQVVSVAYNFNDVKLPPGFTKSAVTLFLTGNCAKCSARIIKKQE